MNWIEVFKRERAKRRPATTTIAILLKSVRNKPRHAVGICGQPAMTYLSPRAFALVRQMMVKWPKFSGKYDYPVPSTVGHMSPYEMFHYNVENLWDRNTEYGALRRELLDWLIEQPELNVRLYKICNTHTQRPVFTTKGREE